MLVCSSSALAALAVYYEPSKRYFNSLVHSQLGHQNTAGAAVIRTQAAATPQ